MISRGLHFHVAQSDPFPTSDSVPPHIGPPSVIKNLIACTVSLSATVLTQTSMAGANAHSHISEPEAQWMKTPVVDSQVSNFNYETV